MPSTKRPAADAAKPTRRAIARRKIERVPFKQKRGGGRPPIYEAAPHCARATKLALLGLTDEEIAFQFGISVETLKLWKAQHPEFVAALNAGKIDADAAMVQSLYNRGLGMKLPAVKIFYDKDKGETIYAPYVEHLAPDVGAAKLWLTNRRPKEWRERREVEVTGTLEHKVAQMTPEERRARLLELQAKAAQVIDGEATEVEEE